MYHKFDTTWKKKSPVKKTYIKSPLSVSPELFQKETMRSFILYVVCGILQNWSLYPHIYWCIPMGLGFNDPWVESHMWPQQTWGQRSSRGLWPLVQVFEKRVTVSTYFDVFSWDFDTMILGWSHTCDLNRLGVNCLVRILLKFSLSFSNIVLCIPIFFFQKRCIPYKCWFLVLINYKNAAEIDSDVFPNWLVTDILIPDQCKLYLLGE